jgi:hypothetical protein
VVALLLPDLLQDVDHQGAIDVLGHGDFPPPGHSAQGVHLLWMTNRQHKSGGEGVSAPTPIIGAHAQLSK